MPKESLVKQARRAKIEGKKPTTQASGFVREEMHKRKHGDKRIKSRKQAIAIGLSKARQAGVKVPPKKRSKKA